MTQPIYAIGDIHGDLEQMLKIHRRIRQDARTVGNDTPAIVHIGDLVDRREHSKQVIEFLIRGQTRGEPWVALKGNHDRLFQWFLEDPKRKDPNLPPGCTWLHSRMGGQTTLASYGITVPQDYDLLTLHQQVMQIVPKSHCRFLASLPASFATDRYIFAHAGLRPNVPLKDQTEDDLIWIKKEFHTHRQPFEKLVIHGHTPVEVVTHYGNRINIDTGAARGRNLSAIVLDGDDIWQLEDHGRVPIFRDLSPGPGPLRTD